MRPDGIDNTGATDVTAPLNAWFKTVPPESEVTIEGTYRVEGGLLIRNPVGLRLVGDGTICTKLPNTEHYGVQTLRLQGGERVQIEGLKLSGPPAFVEPGSGVFRSNGVQGLELAHVTIEDSPSDFVYIAERRSDRRRATNTWIHHCTFDGAHRQGVVVNSSDGALIENNSIGTIARYVFDVEPLSDNVIRNVVVRDNTFGGFGGGFFHLSAHYSCDVGDISFLYNTLTRRQPSALVEASPARRRGLTFCGNVSTDPAHPISGSTAMLRVHGWDGLTVVDNTAYLLGPNRRPVATDAVDPVLEPNNWIRV